MSEPKSAMAETSLATGPSSPSVLINVWRQSCSEEQTAEMLTETPRRHLGEVKCLAQGHRLLSLRLKASVSGQEVISFAGSPASQGLPRWCKW